MTVITISRQMGSLGSQISRLVAEMLGYRLVWRELINQAAQRAGAPETALAAIDELNLLGICPSLEACQAYRRAVEQVMNELAEKDDIVIQGRAGQVILKNHPQALHVRIIAPRALRAERVAQRLDIPLERALAQVEASDRFRANYLRRFYRVRWDDPLLYHLVINTASLSAQQAAEIICSAAASYSTSKLQSSSQSKDA